MARGVKSLNGKVITRVTIAGGKPITRFDVNLAMQISQALAASKVHRRAWLLDRAGRGIEFRNGAVGPIVYNPPWLSAAVRIANNIIGDPLEYRSGTTSPLSRHPASEDST